MTEKCIDTTAMGLFFVALVSLPIAMICFVLYADSTYGLAPSSSSSSKNS